jgi:hypothetical protein
MTLKKSARIKSFKKEEWKVGRREDRPTAPSGSDFVYAERPFLAEAVSTSGTHTLAPESVCSLSACFGGGNGWKNSKVTQSLLTCINTENILRDSIEITNKTIFKRNEKMDLIELRKKSLAVLLVSFMALGMAACSSTGDSDDSASGDSSGVPCDEQPTDNREVECEVGKEILD